MTTTLKKTASTDGVDASPRFTGDQIKMIREVASLDYSGDPNNHLGEYLHITPGAAKQRLNKLYHPLGANDLFTFVTVALKEEVISLHYLGEGLEAKLKRALSLTPAQKSLLRDMRDLALKQKSVEFELLASSREDHVYNPGTLEQTVSGIYKRMGIPSNRAHLAVIAHAIATDDRFNSPFTKDQYVMMMRGASLDYRGYGIDHLMRVSGNTRSGVFRMLQRTREAFGTQDNFSTVVQGLEGGYLPLNLLKGWDGKKFYDIMSKLDNYEREFLDFMFLSAIINGSISPVTISSVAHVRERTAKKSIYGIYKKIGEINEFHLAVLAFGYGIMQQQASSPELKPYISDGPLGYSDESLQNAVRRRRGFSTDLLRMAAMSWKGMKRHVRSIPQRGTNAKYEQPLTPEGRYSTRKALDMIHKILCIEPGYEEAEATGNRDRQVQIVTGIIEREHSLYRHFKNFGLEDLMKNFVDPSGKRGFRKSYSPKALLEFYNENKMLEWFDRTKNIYVPEWRILENGMWQQGEKSAQLGAWAIEDVLYGSISDNTFRSIFRYGKVDRRRNRDEHISILWYLTASKKSLAQLVESQISGMRQSLIDPNGKLGFKSKGVASMMQFYSDFNDLDLFKDKHKNYLAVDGNGNLMVVEKGVRVKYRAPMPVPS